MVGIALMLGFILMIKVLPIVTRSVQTGTPSHVATMPGLAGASLVAAAPTFIVTVRQ